MSVLKRLTAGLLVCMLLFALLPLTPAKAETAEAQTGVFEADPSIHYAYHVNPLYEGIIKPEDLTRRNLTDVRNELKNATVYNTMAEAAAYVRSQLKARAESFAVGFKTTSTDSKSLYYDLLKAAMTHNGTPTEGDYLLFQFGGFSVGYSFGSDCINLTYTMRYYTSAAQETQVSSAVRNVLNSLNLDGLDDYQKISKIYKWICDNITYDYPHLNDNSYFLQYTAYGAIIDRTCVCQGYAVLFYRMALECGVDARVIAGDGGGPHAWNIVKMGNYYYNVDSTWDAGASYFSWFLLNMANFTRHIRGQQYSYWYENGVECHYDWMDYTSTAFSTQYPMGPTNYSYNANDFGPVITRQPANQSASENATVQFSVTATGAGLTYQWEYQMPGTTSWTKTTLTGYNTSTLKVPATAARNGCKYHVIITDSSKRTTTSAAATLTVNGVITITGHPGTKTVTAGSTAQFGVIAFGTGLKYQWQYQMPGSTTWTNTTLSGYNTSLLSVPATTARNGCKYRCLITCSTGAQKASNAATLTVPTPLAITGHPGTKTVAENSTAKFGVIATGTGLTYQWQYQLPGTTTWSNTTLTGCKTSLLSVPATAARNGCKYRVVVKDSTGKTVTSNPATLTISGVITITGHPGTKTVTAGSTAQFGVIAFGAGLKYQWQYQMPGTSAWTNTTLSGYNTNMLNVPATMARNGCKYRCVVTCSTGATKATNPATLTVSASDITNTFPATYSRTISTGGTVANLSFVPSASTIYTFESLDSGDTYITIYDASGSTVDYNDDGGSGTNFKLSVFLRAGVTYRVAIKFYNSSTTGTIKMQVTKAPQIDNTFPKDYNCTIGNSGDSAILTFTPSATAWYSFESIGSYDTFITIYDQNMNELYSDDDSGDGTNFALSVNLKASTTYFVEVHYFGSGTGTIKMHVNKTATQTSFAAAPIKDAPPPVPAVSKK